MSVGTNPATATDALNGKEDARVPSIPRPALHRAVSSIHSRWNKDMMPRQDAHHQCLLFLHVPGNLSLVKHSKPKEKLHYTTPNRSPQNLR